MYSVPESVDIYLAIDPGSEKTGYALVGRDGSLMSYGTLRPKKPEFHESLDTLIMAAQWMVIEKPYLARHRNAATLMVQSNVVGGIRMAWDREHGRDTTTTFPAQTWQSSYRIGGRMNRDARKAKAMAIARIFTNGVEVKPDEADAILMGKFFANRVMIHRLYNKETGREIGK